MRGVYQRLVSPITRTLDSEIEEQGSALERDMELRELAHRLGDREAVDAFEFRMRETYGELLPRVVVRGFINLIPHLLILCGLYYLLPVLDVPRAGQVSTISLYIAVGVLVVLARVYRAWRRRSAPARAGSRDAQMRGAEGSIRDVG